MDGVLCSAILSEQLKIRKPLAIHYWQDLNFEEFQLVL